MQFFLSLSFLGFYWIGGVIPAAAGAIGPRELAILAVAVIGAPGILWGWGRWRSGSFAIDKMAFLVPSPPLREREQGERGRESRDKFKAASTAVDPGFDDRWVMGIWLAFSLLGLTWGGWASLVRNWFGESVWSPLEFPVLLLPSLAALLGCWWAQAHLTQQLAITCTDKPRTGERDLRHVKEYVRLRVHVYLLLALLPLLCISLAQVVFHPLAQAWWGHWSLLPASILTLGGVLAILPGLIARWWGTYSLPEGALRQQLGSAAEATGVRFQDIRIWPTGRRITNALILGSIFPRKTLVLSDGLVDLLDAEQLATVVAHEAGHVRAGHLRERTAWLVAPLVCLAMAHAIQPARVAPLLAALQDPGLGNHWLMWLACPLLYAVYVYALVGWRARQMEIEADLRAIGRRVGRDVFRVDRQGAGAFSHALLRLAEDSGHDPFRGGWLHPSLGARILFISRVLNSPAVAITFLDSQRRQRLWIGLAWVITAILLAGF